MTIDTEIAVAATRDALSLLNSHTTPQSSQEAPAATLAVEEDVSLSLSAQGRLLSALAISADAMAAGTDATGASSGKPWPITRATLLAIEVRLVAARTGARAVAAADAELPASSDPARLARARQATESLYGRAANPFDGYSRAQLSDIVYDESGAYTTNERYAASAERDELDRRYWAPVLQRALASGDWRPMIEAGLVFYTSLSPLEQTAYPSNYLQLLQQALAMPIPMPTDTPLPADQQADLVKLLATLVLPGGPLAVASGLWRNLLLVRTPPSAEALAAAMPKLGDLLPSEKIMRLTQEQGYLLMLQRVFGSVRRDDEPVPLRRAGPATLPRDTLAFADRRYLGQAYVYAAAVGLDLEEVDALAHDLAQYRFSRAGGQATTVEKRGAQMAAADLVSARRMLASPAAQQTQLDHSFLAWLLDPRGGGRSEGERSGHTVGFSALEKLLAGLVGMRIGTAQGALAEADIEADYRYALYHIDVQQQDEAVARLGARAAPPLSPAALAAQLANARGQMSERDFMDNALALLRMYRNALTMSAAEQRTLSELVYASLKRRRLRLRRGRLFVAWATRSPLMPPLPR